MDDAPLKREVDGTVLTITLSRPKANAIDAATSQMMGDVFEAFSRDTALRVAVLTAAGDRIFCAGWDLKAAVGGETEAAFTGLGGFAGLGVLARCDKPIIAAVNGTAVGGGVELMLACDLVIAAEHATFAFPETRLGNMADEGGVQRLPRRIPRAIALEMLLTGRVMSAREAERWGLVNEVVPLSQVLPRARELARTISERAPLSVQAIKEVMRETERLSEFEAIEATRARRLPLHARMLDSEDHREGPRAFVERQPPRWTGQ